MESLFNELIEHHFDFRVDYVAIGPKGKHPTSYRLVTIKDWTCDLATWQLRINILNCVSNKKCLFEVTDDERDLLIYIPFE